MFTGIIQAIGSIDAIERMTEDLRLSIYAGELDIAEVKVGDSIAVNGVCLTATHLHDKHFTAHVSAETLRVTCGLDNMNKVNLENALRLNTPLGGHLVSGHVDGIGTVTRFENLGDCYLLAVSAPHEISKYIAQKGSISVNGVSLTVNTIHEDTFTVNLIPHTLKNTTLGELNIGMRVNLEVDQIARYVERLADWSKA